jgi:hypothetical protein
LVRISWPGIPPVSKGAKMGIELHAPSQIVAVVSLALAVLALVCYVFADTNLAFWMALLAYLAGAIGTIVKTE